MRTLQKLIKCIVLAADKSVVTISFLLQTLPSFMNQGIIPLLPSLHYY